MTDAMHELAEHWAARRGVYWAAREQHAAHGFDRSARMLDVASGGVSDGGLIRERLIGEGLLRPCTGMPSTFHNIAQRPVLRLDDAGKQSAARDVVACRAGRPGRHPDAANQRFLP